MSRSLLPIGNAAILSIFLIVATSCGYTAHEVAARPSDHHTDDRERARQISLNGQWKFKPDDLGSAGWYLVDLDDQSWDTMEVPSNWYLQGHDLSGVVWFRRWFTCEPYLEGQLVQLVFDGVDYTADVWLNGHYVGSHEGSFQPFRFDISEHLRPGQRNLLVVRVNSPLEAAAKDWSLHKRLIKGIFSHHDTRPGGAWSARGQEKNTGGLWGNVFLKVSDQVSLDRVAVTPLVNLAAGEADADITVIASSALSQVVEAELLVSLLPHNFLASPGSLPSEQTVVRVKPGLNSWRIKVHVPDAALWWPWDHGQPNLYQARVTLVRKSLMLDSTDTVFGFRDINVDPKTMTWRINGKRVFLRGTNYISSQWLSEMTPDRYAEDLALMKHAFINAVRVHAHLEREEFYRQCDTLGILVWQDFPLQWGYTEDPSFVTEAERQIQDMVEMLYNHPSVVAWSAHNEPPWDATWMQYKYDTYKPDQNRQLDMVLFQRLRALDQTRYAHMASTTMEHPWFGWYSGSWMDYGKPSAQPLITEYGAQALPSIHMLRHIFSEDELWPDTDEKWSKWEYHNFQRKETFDNAGVRMGKNIDAFIENTQSYQAKLIQFAAESYRRQRFTPITGIFQFMFVEDWPSINWGIVDYARTPKPGYMALRKAYQPVLPSIAWRQESWTVGEPVIFDLWVINDLHQSYPQATLTYTLRTNEKILDTHSWQTDIRPDSSQLVKSLTKDSLAIGQYEVIVKISDMAGRVLGVNEHTFSVTAKNPSVEGEAEDAPNDPTF